MMGCQICSSDKHSSEKCDLILGRKRIVDSALPQRAFLTLPAELETRECDDKVRGHGHRVDVFATVYLAKGTQFGPFEALKRKKFNPSCAYKLAIYYKSRVLHYLDTTNLSKCNWMSLVRFTTKESLRNAICYQLKNEIFFSVVENVNPGQPLIVGYSPGYRILMEESGRDKNIPSQMDVKPAPKKESSGSDDSDTTYDHDYIVPTSSNDIQSPIVSKKMTAATRSSRRLQLKKPETNIEPFDETKEIYPESTSDTEALRLCLDHDGPTTMLTTDMKTRKKRRRNCHPLRDVEVWECKFCLEKVDTIVNFAQHLTTHYKNFKSIEAKVVKNIQVDVGSSDLDKTKVIPYTCDICTVKPYNRLESIISHLRIAHLSNPQDTGTNSIEGFIKCHACHHYFANDGFYKNHECISPVISCAICQMVFDNRTDLKYHSAEHSDKDFTCSRCNKILTNASFGIHALACEKVHLLSQSSEFRCAVVCCWIGCQTELDFKNFHNHLAEHTHPLCCSSCSIRLRNPKELNQHRCQKFKCDGCTDTRNSLFDSIPGLKNHFLQSHPNSTGIQCLECTLPFATKEGYEKHGNCEQAYHGKYIANRTDTGKYENVVRFVCEVCGATYSNKSSLKTHRTTHSGRKFVCTVCGKGFSRKALLQDHQHVHGDPKFSCSVCGKRVKTLKSLSVHRLIHSDLKPFSCDICSKGFAQKINLQSHLRSHLPRNEKQEICEECGKTFASREYLKLHLETHRIGEKFCCDVCDAQFIRPYILHQHKKAVHGNDVYKCEFCSPHNNQPHFRQKYSLQRHLVREHSDAKDTWDVEGYLNNMLVPGDGSLCHPKITKTHSKTKDDGESLSTTLSHYLDLTSTPEREVSSVTSISPKKPRLSVKLAKLQEKNNELNHFVFDGSSSNQMPEDLEIENEVIVGEEDDSSRTEITLTLDDDTSELYTKNFADHSNLKDENIVLLQLDDSGRYVIAFSHDVNLK